MKPLTPAEAGQAAEDLIVTYMALALPPDVIGTPGAPAPHDVLDALLAKVVLAMIAASSGQVACQRLAILFNEVERMHPRQQPTIVHPQPARPQ